MVAVDGVPVGGVGPGGGSQHTLCIVCLRSIRVPETVAGLAELDVDTNLMVLHLMALLYLCGIEETVSSILL